MDKYRYGDTTYFDESSSRTTKYERKHSCPYCDKKDTRENLIVHINDKHEEMIPEGYTARRIVFNQINHTDHGTCMICKCNTEWNEAVGKYGRLCGKESCKKEFQERTAKNYIKVLGTDNPADLADHQEKMLAHRGISKTYKFKNGQTVVYTGDYERRLLEFEEKVMGFKADDIMMPGPIINYMYDGKDHKWITDQLLIPYNLIIEVKDGGKNPNRRPMEDYRAKQVAKELSITQLGTYNYLRLTDNDFGQLLGILAELKANAMYDEEANSKKVIINVNESGPVMGAIPSPYGNGNTYVINYGMKNTFIGDDTLEGQIFTKDLVDGLTLNDDDLLETVKIASFLEGRNYTIYEYVGEREIADLNESVKISRLTPLYIYEAITESVSDNLDQMDWDDRFKKIEFESSMISDELNKECISEIIENSIRRQDIVFDIYDPFLKEICDTLLEGFENITIQQDIKGYFAKRKDKNLRGASYKTIAEIPNTILKTLNNTMED